MASVYQIPVRTLMWVTPWVAAVALSSALVWFEREKTLGDLQLVSLANEKTRLVVQKTDVGVSHISISVVTPNNQRVFENAKKTAFWFQWKTDRPLKTGQFRFELSLTPQFTTILAALSLKEMRLSSSQLALRPGKYYWRIHALDQGGAELGVSPAANFEYLIKTGPRAPSASRVRVGSGN